jgi:hypothetical protein
MLAVSAMMLASSTYAWFTMSREVEVSNISMSATVPEDIQISLGAIGIATNVISTKEGEASLTNGLGVLYAGATGTADNGAVQAPTNDWDWSNIADISEYYQFGKLIPASSTDGKDIFFTAQASGNGQTLLANAEFYQANDAANALAANTQAAAFNKTGDTTPLTATLHAITAKNNEGYVTDQWSTAENTGNDAVNYAGSIGWDNTQDDGYYVDIPVWFRTSSTAGARLSVQGYVKPRDTDTEAGATDENALYRAVRVAIIDVGDGTGNAAPYTFATSFSQDTPTRNLIPLADGWTLKTDQAAGSLKDNPFAFDATTNTLDKSILNWYGRTYNTGASAASHLTVSDAIVTSPEAQAAVKSLSANTATYGAAVVYDPINQAAANAPATNTICELTGPASANGSKAAYGVPHKIIIRVWLEGEDPDCWNETAGQDWSINLKFNNEITSPLGTYGGTDLSDVNQNAAPRPVPSNP